MSQYGSVPPVSNENAVHHDKPFLSVLVKMLSSDLPPVPQDVCVTAGLARSTTCSAEGALAYKQSQHQDGLLPTRRGIYTIRSLFSNYWFMGDIKLHSLSWLISILHNSLNFLISL